MIVLQFCCGCSAAFSALFKIQTRTNLLVIYVRCFMYFGLLVYFIHVIIAKFGQFNLYKAHYLTSSCCSNPIAYHLFIPLKCEIVCKFVGLASCDRACDAKSLTILVPSREEVILDLQRSRQKDPIANQQLLSYFFWTEKLSFPEPI